MANPNPSQLFLLADHVKLSLLERQRAISLNLNANSNDRSISRSLDSLQTGVDAIETQLSTSEDASLRDQYKRLRSQLDDLSAQFQAPISDAAVSTDATLNSPNDPALKADFDHARTRRQNSSKSVRFTDAPSEADTAALFPSRYTDEPDGPPDQSELSNQQIHAYHSEVLRDQDAQLDQLGASIGRQRDLSIQIGNELDDHAMMLDEVDERVDRHQNQLDRAKGRLGKVARKAKENWSMTTIVVLIIILVLLIVITK